MFYEMLCCKQNPDIGKISESCFLIYTIFWILLLQGPFLDIKKIYSTASTSALMRANSAFKSTGCLALTLLHIIEAGSKSCLPN